MKTGRRLPVELSPEAVLLRRTTRMAAVQTTLALGAVLLLVGVVFYVVDSHIQSRQIDALLSEVAAQVDDVDDPPPGMSLAIARPDGSILLSAHAPAPMTALVTGPTGYHDLSSNDVDYRALVIVQRHNRRVAVLTDLTQWQQSRDRLLEALLIAEIAGLVSAGAVSVLLSRRAIRPLVAALELQRRFVADASHELRAPLTVLHTRAQLLARRAEREDLDAVVADQLHGLVADTRALSDIVDDLLTVAAAEREPARTERVDLAELCREVRESVVAHASSRDIAVEVVLSPEPAFVDGVRPALRRAIFALTDNALNHESPGGTVTLGVARAGADVEVTVSDTGAGLDPRHAERLFRRFAHGDGHSAGARPYGIGLALVRDVVDAHHGSIIVDGAPGHGAAFTLRLPAADPEH
ncbi:HAMP domain-containing sensor histidine kinase [Nocardia sp. NPDC006630]|uniref:sensor histidine kinase n=1 Tax=Nocardia sp. NPDC006630 TaxID=3157181 RepID=UPI0033B17A2A